MKIQKRLDAGGTAKRRLFAAEYVKDFNATHAYIRAGLPHKNRAVARAMAAEWIHHPEVIAFVQALSRKAAKAADVSVEMVIRELHAMATADVGDMFLDNNTLSDIKAMPEHLRKAISSVEVDETYESTGEHRVWTGYTRKVKLWEKTRALELLGKHLQMWVEKLQISGDIQLVYGHRQAPKTLGPEVDEKGEVA